MNPHDHPYITFLIGISLLAIFFWNVYKTLLKMIDHSERRSKNNYRYKSGEDFIKAHENQFSEIDEILNIKNIPKQSDID